MTSRRADNACCPPYQEAADVIMRQDGAVPIAAGLSKNSELSARDASLKTSKIGVIFATRGRAGILEKVFRSLDASTRVPDEIIVSAVGPEDLGNLRFRRDIRSVFGLPGLTQQRNRALRSLSPDIDVVVFFDDDFLPHPRWLEVVEHCFNERPGVAAITGRVVADGIKGPGLSFQQAMAVIDSCRENEGDYIVEGFSPYGCNMAFRRLAIEGLCFDERLVLYGWLEDRDYGGAIAKRGGKCVKLGNAIGVHLGIKEARVSGRRLGYSQVVNPIYLRRKGTMTTSSLVDHLFRNITSNLVRSMWPEPHVDRIGRLVGNARGARDLLAGIVAPERAELL
jgi:glycosyltransferase involved in cell wall biosynthesis